MSVPVGQGLDAVWVVYSKRPSSLLPRRWTGLVNYGRLDIVVRILLAALYPGGEVLGRDALLLYLDEGGDVGTVIAFTPECLPQRALYEHELGPIVLDALRGSTCSSVEDVSLVYVLRRLRRMGYSIASLSEKGAAFREHRRGTVYVLGSYYDPPRAVVDEADSVYSIGPCSYLASHVAAFINAVRLGFIKPL